MSVGFGTLSICLCVCLCVLVCSRSTWAWIVHSSLVPRRIPGPSVRCQRTLTVSVLWQVYARQVYATCMLADRLWTQISGGFGVELNVWTQVEEWERGRERQRESERDRQREREREREMYARQVYATCMLADGGIRGWVKGVATVGGVREEIERQTDTGRDRYTPLVHSLIGYECRNLEYGVVVNGWTTVFMNSIWFPVSIVPSISSLTLACYKYMFQYIGIWKQ